MLPGDCALRFRSCLQKRESCVSDIYWWKSTQSPKQKNVVHSLAPNYGYRKRLRNFRSYSPRTMHVVEIEPFYRILSPDERSQQQAASGDERERQGTAIDSESQVKASLVNAQR